MSKIQVWQTCKLSNVYTGVGNSKLCRSFDTKVYLDTYSAYYCFGNDIYENGFSSLTMEYVQCLEPSVAISTFLSYLPVSFMLFLAIWGTIAVFKRGNGCSPSMLLV